MGINLTTTRMYLKKINQDKKSILFIFLWGLIFDIAWIIPEFDILSLICPIVATLKDYIILPICNFYFIRTYNPAGMCILILTVCFFIFSFFSVIYIFFHCKAYNIVVKKILNLKSNIKIRDLFFEKSDNLRKYFVWELSCFFIKFLIIVSYFIWSKFFANFSLRAEHVLIAMFVWCVLLAFHLYTILTRALVVPVFISNKYEDLNSKGIFELSKRIFSLKLILPVIVCAFICIVFNILVCIIGFFAVMGMLNSSFSFFSVFLLFAFVFLTACFAYHVGLFVFIYSCSCQQLIFPEYPLILSSESEDVKIKKVYSVFEKEDES